MDVTSLQTGLAAAGIDPGPIDGDAGPRTWGAAVQRVSRIGPMTAQPIGAALAVAIAPQYGLDDRASIINFLANVAHESGFRLVSEDLNYSAGRLVLVWPSRFPTREAAKPFAHNPQALADKVYGGRMGNIKTGDGYRFRGRAWPQLTGREAYGAVGKILGVDLEDDPDWTIRTRENCALTAAGFWKWKRLDTVTSPREVRLRWNGGTEGMIQVMARIDKLETVWP